MSNRLSDEKSPYLLDHAENPVNWYPWGQEAFNKAYIEDKPIFLSVGFAANHWCSVMNRESFQDKAVADLLNTYYICVKVDSEERPDIDMAYMSACELLNNGGGWPVTVLMTWDKKPFFAASYIPRDNTGGRVGLISLLTAVAHKWKTGRAALLQTAKEILPILQARQSVDKNAPIPGSDEQFIKKAVAQLAASYDEEYGGFGSSAKFPSGQNLVFLTRYCALSGDKKTKKIVDGTLMAMYKGGIYDHFGGGFFRCSVDREWLVPHFEKTLADNAMLAYTYIEAWQDGHLALYRDVAENTLDYCMRELAREGGGYYSAQDSESGTRNGAYYLFKPEEIQDILGPDAGKHFCECYDITKEGNYHGKNIPNLLINTRWNLVPEGYDDYREQLRLYREKRMPIKLDTNVSAAQNGLMLMALAKGAKAFNDQRYLRAAQELAEFMENNLADDGNGNLFFNDRFCEKVPTLDSYADFAMGLLELYDADYNPAHISLALKLLNLPLSEKMNDFKGEMFAFYKSTAADLPFRPAELHDGALPSGNSMMAVVFDKLFHLCADKDWEYARDEILSCISRAAGQYPAGSPWALCAMLNKVYTPRDILCVSADENAPDMLKTIKAGYAPQLTSILKTPGNAKALGELNYLTQKADVKDEAKFYIMDSEDYTLKEI